VRNSTIIRPVRATLRRERPQGKALRASSKQEDGRLMIIISRPQVERSTGESPANGPSNVRLQVGRIRRGAPPDEAARIPAAAPVPFERTGGRVDLTGSGNGRTA